MPSPIKASVSSHATIIDGYIKECPLDPGLQSVMDDRCLDLLAVKARAMQAVVADRMRPKYDRLGMKRLAWLFHVSERTMYEWWAAYQEGGADALRRHTENLGRKPKVSREVLEETRDKLLARNAQAEAAKNIEDAREDRDAKKAADAGAAGKGGGGKEEAAADAGAGAGAAADAGAGAGAAGAAWSAECIACLIAAGLAPAGEWYAGRDGTPRPGKRGWRQRRLPPRCKCGGECTMPSGRKRRDCKCEPGRQCRCACCEPLTLPPLGPPHARGCPALATSPPHSLTPKEFGAEIKRATGVEYSRSHLYDLLASLNLSPKAATAIHANRALRRNILRWQRRVRKRIDRLRARGYTVVAIDEAFLVYNTKKGKKHWSLVGKRVMQLYTGSHKRTAPHCAFAEDGRRLTRFFARANSYTFIEFLRQITAKFGRVAVIADQYSAHFSYVVKEFIKKNRKDHPERDIQMVRFPVGCPFLNVVEQCWSQLKRRVVVGEHHASFEDLRRAASKFMRTAQFDLSLEDYLYAKPPPDITS